ncbi:hypothetical protein NC980_11910 [Leptolyngbya sp. AS-A5]|uniref:hypothetical protein n=1 Tax=Leptolyngbya sp. AS-A5 TaxID=2933919 RepID=UPI003297CB99
MKIKAMQHTPIRNVFIGLRAVIDWTIASISSTYGIRTSNHYVENQNFGNAEITGAF